MTEAFQESPVEMTTQDAKQEEPSKEIYTKSPSHLSAHEALEIIRRGDILKNVTVHDLSLRGEFEHPIECVHVTFHQLDVRKAVFHQNVMFRGCHFHRTKFKKSQFKQNLHFRASTFYGCQFYGIEVENYLEFEKVKAEKDITFRGGTCGHWKCWGAVWNDWLEFHGFHFREEADFRSFTAQEGVVFRQCTFDKNLIMRGSTVCKKLDLEDSTVHGCLDLSKCKLNDMVYLESIQQGPEQQFAFANALADRILLKSSQLKGRLASEKAGQWLDASYEYGLLQKNFQNLNRYEEEDWALYRFKVNQRRSQPRSWWRPWGKLKQFGEWLFLDCACGYGTNPARAVISAILMILFFAGIYASGLEQFQMEQPLVGETIVSLENRLVFGLVTSVSVFTAGFTGDQLYHAQGWMLLPLSVEALLGTLLWGFFIVAFSRKVIR
ncbi:Hypothetical protein PBC10988_20360 [Planctomycetales bacterium 10988]|nr:Hypothetical protein PBC10988_20360 [Planctomycetales bacterium 10988]